MTALVRSIFAQPDKERVRAQHEGVVELLEQAQQIGAKKEKTEKKSKMVEQTIAW